MLIFDDESENDWNRAEGAGAAVAGHPAAGSAAADGHRLEPGRPDLLVHAAQHQSRVRPDGAESRSRTGCSKSSSNRCPTWSTWPASAAPRSEYQVRIDPDKLMAYGLSIGQVEQQLANNNVNAGGSFIEAGLAADQRARGRPGAQRSTTSRTPCSRRKTARRCGSTTSPWSRRARRSGWARSARRSIAPTARSSTTTTWSKASCCCARAPTPTHVLEGIHDKVEELNDSILPPGVKVVPFLDRSDLVHYTTHTVLHNLTEGIILVVIILFLFLGNVRGALIVALTIPFSLLFASICLDLQPHSGQPAVAGRARFRHGGGWRGGDGGEHRAPPGPRETTARTAMERIREAAHEVQRPVFYAIGIIITAYLPIFTLQRVEGRLFKPMAWTVAFALLGALMFSMLLAPVLASFLFRSGTQGMAQPGDDLADQRATGSALRWAIRLRWVTVGVAAACAWRLRSISLPAASSAPSSCRIWMKAPSGCAARWRPAPARPRARALTNQARRHFRLVSPR